MAKVIFLLLVNLSNGGQEIAFQSEPMAFEQCDKLQRSIWAGDWPIVLPVETIPMPSIDAACIPMGE